MTLTFELVLDNSRWTKRTKYPGQRSFSLDTHQTDCSTWTTKVVGKETYTAALAGAFSALPNHFPVHI